MTSSQTVPVTAFKAKCLTLIEEITDQGGEVLITKGGVPIAKLVPIPHDARQTSGEDQLDSVIGCMAGTVTIHGDIIGPFPEDWQVDRD